VKFDLRKLRAWGSASGPKTFSRPAHILLFLLALIGPATAQTPTDYAYVVNAYPHDTQAFTEGLFYLNGYLYESTGLNGQSTIRKEKLETGEVVQQQALDSRYFGEGIVDWKSQLIQLTWQSQIGFVYDLETFKQRQAFHYHGEGWGLTRDDQHIIMSDGTNTLRFLDPETLKEVGSISVTADGRAIGNLNELEWVKGEIYANIWQSNVIARIDPKSGNVLAWIDLSNVVAAAGVHDNNAVLNGIAYDQARDRLFVTGKLWPWLFEIRLAHRNTSAKNTTGKN
jgi:glutaminyl-peptide cyclotransferase